MRHISISIPRARVDTTARVDVVSSRSRRPEVRRSLLMRSHARASTSARSHAARARRPSRPSSTSFRAQTGARPRALPRDDGGDDAPRALDFNGVAREHATAHDDAPISARLARREFGLGDSGTDVALTQRLLGLDSHGVCDAATSEEIKRFQRSRDGLHPSGFFGASSRAQVAREEEAWRARGGGELLRAYAREARRAEGETLVSVDWRARARAPVWSGWSARAIQGAVWVAATGVVVGAALAAAKKVETKTEEEPANERTSLTRVRDSALALGERTARSLDAARVSGVARLAAFAALASRARRVVADRVSRLRAPALARRAAAGDEQPPTITEGHFDANGRWWESPIPRPTAAAAAAEPVVDASMQKSRRAEQMRERWVNIRRQQVNVSGSIDERRAIKRVSEFLGDDDKPRNV